MEFAEILRILSGPLIGMVIGYFTNYLAVKMLFRPLYPKKIGKWQLPFTPGVIPKRQGALAASLGHAVADELFTTEDLHASLASPAVENAIADAVLNGMQKLQDGNNVGDVATMVMGEENYFALRETIFEKALGAVVRNVEEMNLGDLVGEEVKNYVEAFVSNNALLGFVLTKDRIARIAEQFAERLDDFLSENLELMVAPRLAGEMEKIELYELANFTLSVDALKDTVHQLYSAFLANCMPKILAEIDIAKTVESKIAAMDARDLEKLVLGVMKKELGAVVNLGAVLGFVIGILNIFL